MYDIEMNCKRCSIYKVRDYIKNNRKEFDVNSKCGKCIALFSLRLLLDKCEYYDPRSKKYFDQIEKDFDSYVEYEVIPEVDNE